MLQFILSCGNNLGLAQCLEGSVRRHGSQWQSAWGGVSESGTHCVLLPWADDAFCLVWPEHRICLLLMLKRLSIRTLSQKRLCYRFLASLWQCSNCPRLGLSEETTRSLKPLLCGPLADLEVLGGWAPSSASIPTGLEHLPRPGWLVTSELLWSLGLCLLCIPHRKLDGWEMKGRGSWAWDAFPGFLPRSSHTIILWHIITCTHTSLLTLII